MALITVPGGRVPEGEPKDVDVVLAAAVDGLDITADEVRQTMEPADLADVAAGRIGEREVRAFAEHLLGASRGGDGNSAA